MNKLKFVHFYIFWNITDLIPIDMTERIAHCLIKNKKNYNKIFLQLIRKIVVVYICMPYLSRLFQWVRHISADLCLQHGITVRLLIVRYLIKFSGNDGFDDSEYEWW